MQAVPAPALAPTRYVDLAIAGMSCGHCVAAVQATLADLPGVEVRHVAVGAASVVIDPAATSLDALRSAVAEAGYEARLADRPSAPSVAADCCATRRG